MNPSTTQNVIQIPERSRAVLVWQNDDGSIGRKDVPQDCAVLNIERDLRSHLNDFPYSDAWLLQLRDYIDQRLSARNDARRCGSIAVPVSGGALWSVLGHDEAPL